MYYGSLRISEVANSGSLDHTVMLDDVTFSSIYVKINLRSYKHSKHAVSLRIYCSPDTEMCPVYNLNRYMLWRGRKNDPFLFVDHRSVPISRQQVSDSLKHVLSLAQMCPNLYNTHSFRIGRTTDLFKQNASDEFIRRSGRWASDAWRKYIKVSDLDIHP